MGSSAFVAFIVVAVSLFPWKVEFENQLAAGVELGRTVAQNRENANRSPRFWIFNAHALHSFRILSGLSATNRNLSLPLMELGGSHQSGQPRGMRHGLHR